MTHTIHCTYCGRGLGEQSEYDAGDVVACDACGVDWGLDREPASDRTVFECPYCTHDNMRAATVATVRCERESCDLVFDPAGANSHDPAESDLRWKMTELGGGV